MIKRILHYAKTHGIRPTLSRAVVGAQRAMFGGGMVLFVCDLDAKMSSPVANSGNARVERKSAEAEVEAADIAAVTAWNPEAGLALMRERFSKGATLWLFKQDDEVAAYGWTLIGKTVEPHYVTIGPADAHLFDFFVLPKFRGRGINPALVRHILAQLPGEKATRAFIEAAEWNTPQLTSLAKTPFKKMGLARKSRFGGKPVVTLSH